MQDSSISESFYRDVAYPHLHLSRSCNAWNWEGSNIQVTAWEKAFDRSAYILRFFSGSETSQTVKLTFRDLHVDKVFKSDLQEHLRDEIELDNNIALIPVCPKEIVTLVLSIAE